MGSPPGRCAHCPCETGGGAWAHRSPSPTPTRHCFPAGPGALSLCPELRIMTLAWGVGPGAGLDSHVLRHSQSLVGVSETTEDTLGSITQD